jgi:hypothetical protein
MFPLGDSLIRKALVLRQLGQQISAKARPAIPRTDLSDISGLGSRFPNSTLEKAAKIWIARPVENLSQPILKQSSHVGIEAVSRSKKALKVGDRRCLLQGVLRHKPAGPAHEVPLLFAESVLFKRALPLFR